MISETTIQRVRELDIVEVVKPYTQLRRVGATLMGCCPLHNERTPSFSVTPSKGLFYCHSCRKGGDGLGFIREKEGLDFTQAVEFLAKQHNIPIEYIQKEQTDEQIQAAKRRESLFIVNELVQKFFIEQLTVATTDEAKAAREYAYSRWGEEFCSIAGIGYAPTDGRAFTDYCKSKAISEDLLFQLGLLRRSEKGYEYAMFRERITIPIYDRLGRIRAYTARYFGSDDKQNKYKNSTNSEIFVKSESIFGINKASRCRDAGLFNVVEGAPDVLRLQSIGLNNSVATLGTAWSDNQFEQLKHFTNSLCFIPDSDPPKPGDSYGPGFKAVMDNGARAVLLGFDVTVRELPFAYAPEDTELTESQKNDPDSYITSKEVYSSIEEKPFVVWLAEKRFAVTDSLAEQRKCVAEIAEILRHINDPLVADSCIEQLAKIHGKVKLWREAISRAKGEARQRAAASPKTERERDLELLRQFNLSIRDNCYFTYDGDEEPTRLSNFILNPLYHIKDDRNGTRIFEMINRFGYKCTIELSESELCSLATFQQRVGSLGNFVWRAKIDKLNNVKEYTYAKTESAERIRRLGWDIAAEFFAFGNGIVQDGRFRTVDNLGIIRECNGHTYYLPAMSIMHRNNPDDFQFEKLMVHEKNSALPLYDFAEKLVSVFGENAKIAICYLIATLFRDIVFRRTRHFPILNLFGEKGTGKTTLATCLQSFFLHGIDPPNLAVTSIPGMNDRVSEAVNILTVFDEYKNDLDPRKIAFIKGMWGGAGQTKKNMNGDGKAQQTMVTTGIALCGQDKPTQDMALFTRLLYLEFHKTSFNQEERKNYDDLVALCNLGLTHLTVELLAFRLLFEKNFPQQYSLAKSELAARVKEEKIHDRIFGNWVIPLAVFRTLEASIELPFSYNDLFDLALRNMRNQNEYAQESSEVADFWNTLQGYQTAGKCREFTHYRIQYLTRFRALSMKEDIIFPEAKPVLFLNAPAVALLFNGGGKGAGTTANRSNWSTILSYLKSNKSFLGLKQQRFKILTPTGYEETTVLSINGTSSSTAKYNRPKALCFDYSVLKEEFGLTLETENLTEAEELAKSEKEYAPTPPPATPKSQTLFTEAEEELPF